MNTLLSGSMSLTVISIQKGLRFSKILLGEEEFVVFDFTYRLAFKVKLPF